ncbi:MAG TPA: monofunctional biosynthetic peptidoglycan transglycosylase, partial [Rhodobacterales bacterium]|nr:monofunctional biosynthetic peptidoglycan transglycosylase [Rhodobacterales bacterium]
MRPIGKVFNAVWWWLRLAVLLFSIIIVLGVLAFAVINPPTTLYIASEKARLGHAQHEWVDLDDIAPVMRRSVVAAEDANFCGHWGFDMA